MESNIFKTDLDIILNADFISWDKLNKKVIFVTGATGLIGYSVIRLLLWANESKNLGLSVIALVRSVKRAKDRFSEFEYEIEKKILQFIEGNVEDPYLPDRVENVDYIIHGASQTSSKGFVNTPVETINTSVKGTENLLKIARKNKTNGFVYLSSMEVYGHPGRGHKVSENEIGAMTPLEIRNSYPISKQLSEALCVAYAREYNVPAVIIRLGQTFGEDVNYNDGRIFAYFIKCIREHRDIILKTPGDSERSYIHADDAASAILTLLLKGEKGEAYNASDEKAYYSIKQIAEKIAEKYNLILRFELQDESENGYPAPAYMDLDTSKIRQLGWKPLLQMWE